MDPCTRRIFADLRDLRKRKLDDGTNNIIVKVDEKNMRIMYVVIIGAKGTPYEGGFYFFLVEFPEDYPHKCPKVKFCTLDKGVRFNPNLYRDGKVCLSLLGTWSGPGWTSCCTIASILLSIQSLVLHDKPLTNEPGFENSPKESKSCFAIVIVNIASIIPSKTS